MVKLQLNDDHESTFFPSKSVFTLFDQKKSESVRCCHVNQFRKISNCEMVFKNEKDSHAYV